MPIGGGAALGTAHGAISIDTSSLRSISSVVRSVATDVGRSFGAIDVSAKRVEANILRVSRGIGQMRGELAGLGIGAGIIAGLGVKTAAGFQESAIKLAGMTGGVDKATKLMEDLRKKAFAAGLPFQDMLATAERLLPTFKGNVAELDRWYNIVRRVAVLNPTEGMTGAAFSINEAIVSGGTDMVSLVERFNISRVKLREELAKNGGDFNAALDTVLTQMGITDETAQKMGQTFNASFRVAKDAALQLLAEGFTPLMNALTPILQGTAQWVSKLREASPALVGIGAGMVTITALGAPTLLLFNQLVEAGQRLKALGILGGLGKAAVGVAASAVGAGIGVGAVNAVGHATGNKRMQDFGLQQAGENLHKLLFNITWTLTKAFQGLIEAFARFTNMIGGPLDMVVGLVKRLGEAVMGMIHAAGSFISGMAAMIPAGMGGDSLRKQAAGLFGPVTATSKSGAQALAASAAFRKQSDAWLLDWANNINPPTAPGDNSATGRGPGGGAPNTGARDNAIAAWAQSAARIEREAGKARLDATRQYEQQRSEAIANYELGIARDTEDFARSRARAATQLARQIADIQADAAKREADWQADLAERVAEIRSDGNERLTELEANYNRDRERAERDHRDRLMTAAARLDAVAVAEEMRNYSRQQQDASEAFQTQQDKLREDLAERLQQEHENQQERLQAAREADQERIADMIQNQAEQQALEDEDRALRLERQAEDQARQLEQMDASHAERLSQISQQAAEERQALNKSFVQELNQLGIHRDAWLDLQKKQQDLALKQFQTFWSQFNQQFPNRPGNYQDVPTPFPGNLGQFPTSFADFNLSATRTGAASAASGGSVSNRSINVAEGAIVINASPNHDETAIGRQVDYHLRKILEEAAN